MLKQLYPECRGRIGVNNCEKGELLKCYQSCVTSTIRVWLLNGR